MLHQLKWISLAQAANFVIPVLLMPILAHRLGLTGFASFVILTGISQYSTLGVELGLNYVALAEIKRTNCPLTQKAIFSEIFYLKVILAVVICFLVAVAAAVTQVARVVHIPTLAFLLSGSLITCIGYPAWFFILTDRLDINFNIAFASRVLLLVLCILVVAGPDDYIKAAALFNYAMLPVAALYAKKWVPYLLGPQSISGRAVARRLINGLQLSGAMLRETITNVGLAPLYGLCAFDDALGSYAFAEKVSKIVALPAPIVTSAVIANTPSEARIPPLPAFLFRFPWLNIAAAVVLLYGLGAVAIRIGVDVFFPQFFGAVPMIYVLAGVTPIIYFNYLELGMRYTKHGFFRAAAKLSYTYVAMLLLASLCLASRYGVWGLVVAAFVVELLQMTLLLRCRKQDVFS